MENTVEGLERNFGEPGLPSITPSIFPATKHSQSPLAIYSSTGNGSKNCTPWKAEKAVCYFVHTDKVELDSSTAKNKELQPVKRDVAQPFHKLSPCFGRLKAPENPASERGMIHVLHIHDVGE